MPPCGGFGAWELTHHSPRHMGPIGCDGWDRLSIYWCEHSLGASLTPRRIPDSGTHRSFYTASRRAEREALTIRNLTRYNAVVGDPSAH